MRVMGDGLRARIAELEAGPVVIKRAGKRNGAVIRDAKLKVA
jgi:hypothetical protein